MDFEDFQKELSLKMNENIQQDFLKRQKEEDELLLNIKNEKIKQDEINKKKIEDDNKQRELAIKASQDAEIKRNVDNALAIQKQQMTIEHEKVKQKLIADYNKQIQTLKTELGSAKASILSYSSSYSSMNTKCENLQKEYTQYVSKSSPNGSTNNYSTSNYSTIGNTTFDFGFGYSSHSCSDTAKICNRCNKLKCETHTGWESRWDNNDCDLKISCSC